MFYSFYSIDRLIIVDVTAKNFDQRMFLNKL